MNSSKNSPNALPVTMIAAFTFVLAALVPAVVIAARDNNAFVLGITIPAMLILLVMDGIFIGLLRKGKGNQ